LVLGHQEGWPPWCWASLAASAVAFGAFVVVERRVQASGVTPLVPGSVLRAPGLAVGAAVLLIAMISYGGFLFSLGLHLQSGLGLGAAHAGLAFAPMAAGFAATGLTWRQLPQRWHARVIPLGLVLAAAAYTLLALAVRDGRPIGITAETELFVIGLALGLAFSPMLTVALARVPQADAADASGVLVTVFQLGQVVGVATLGTLYLSLGTSASGLVAVLGALAVLSCVAAVVAIPRAVT
ncbi:MAG: MFS transporter, partial [Jatrophihabitantaceae bacterium]